MQNGEMRGALVTEKEKEFFWLWFFIQYEVYHGDCDTQSEQLKVKVVTARQVKVHHRCDDGGKKIKLTMHPRSEVDTNGLIFSFYSISQL